MSVVRLNEIAEQMDLVNLTPSMDLHSIRIREPEINRPGTQLAGYFDHFAAGRIQIIGLVEYSYMTHKMGEEEKRDIYDRYLSLDMPCVVFCRGLEPDEVFMETARHYNVPILRTQMATSAFMAELIRWLNVRLAPTISIHGVLVDIYGVGVLITGESGIGKSETALELVKRGHRLVSDDVVEIRKVSEVTLVGTAPSVTKHLIELRGIGIVDVKTLFGVSSVRNSQNIDLVIELEEWSKDKEYDRIGLEENYTEYLGNKVVCHRIPIRPGRNLSIICEAAAVNHRQKQMGYNAAEALYKRVTENMMRRHSEEDDDE